MTNVSQVDGKYSLLIKNAFDLSKYFCRFRQDEYCKKLKKMLKEVQNLIPL